jgi:hypothetical protein
VTIQATVRALGDDNSVYLIDAPDHVMTVQAKRVTPEIPLARGQIVELQRRDRVGWVPVSRVRAPASGTDVKVSLVVPTRAGNAAYRVLNRASLWTQAYATSPFVIHQTDYVRYASYIASARRVMGSFCGQIPIYVDAPGVLPGNPSNPQNAIGRAWGSWWSESGTHTLRTLIELRSGMSGTNFKHVALHECAHVIQFRANVVDNYDAEQGRAWRFFPYSGFEGQADCMAYLYVRDPWSLYYVPGCSSAQLTEAARMWNTYGYRFTSSPYVWHDPAASAAASQELSSSAPGPGGALAALGPAARRGGSF